MSRIGRKAITIPGGVEVKQEGQVVTVKGPKGTLTREFRPEIGIQVEENTISVTRPNDEPFYRSLHGLTRTLLANMVEGVSNGFSKNLDLVGVGYRAALSGKKLVLTVGKSHPVEMEPYEGIEIEVPAPNKVIIKGIDKEQVGNFAADVRKQREPEPYKGKGIKYEKEVIRRKEGKTGGKK
ncbi:MULTISPECIES: 50S ribosomal protein L6 [Dehalobacter]|jgi:large subunit ribosomal protein L6|uniref:Large ribosomal subunit protein uL6 n=2 Tax=Dehalobacter restrictus TaxID=55583 RepID=A0A857DG94_9FIRM|nr:MULTISPECIES: 50S ribosomal protein L6 [Dehalobacter]AHF09119.1 50S ribosomal protein L6 [Dehalobacter restrictus DSM 9455]MCG1024426.1 50S ribosomal protein L6 [Dehalobacter sp.]MDJ0306858.1 50S ribosomal protein L6 [Dehalobacter sp.]OCZ53732.1 50S ribosomal protein L6 [Dehalobacter sp. TeCB1]QGZ99657.1 50S ribosomal protein L6 [Dehalobacter restrictus]